ncbi:hypothetical protein K491DRAFT_655110 [Lophiostoma macrostomum CBS 122681]|uniref:Uncharacterized protein n=1 Tax=Lophiostoma macrostomum CBS 122681 TaxID=1314788 RepID=A0A6A6TB78_9PLEO|nr:hypothetical protein K491DRAFT_655110 [Lophiostoma macrostomum CBS 122681]
MPEPPSPLAIPQANEAGPGPQDTAAVLHSPRTPASAEGHASLQNLIMEQDAQSLDETSRQRLERHLQKCIKAAQSSFAKGALQQNHIRLLISITNEAKVRRSTKSVILAKAEGEAKVMSYKDFDKARAKRAEQDAAKDAKEKTKGKRGRKPKKATEIAENSATIEIVPP